MLRFSACAVAFLAVCGTARAAEPAHPKSLDDMIISQAKRHGVPEKLVRRIVMRESKYNPRARNHAFWGLMQISYPTARSMGFKGTPSELLDPLVNLTYAVPYLANAFVIAGKQEDQAVRLYASGYYQTAKNRHLLDELRTADSDPISPGESFLVATAKPVTTLLTAVANVPNAQLIAAAAPPVGSIPPQQAGQVGGGSDNEPEVMMSAGKAGYQPPKKWTKDGGITVIARGEQRIDDVAAYAALPGAPPKHGTKQAVASAHGKIKKNTEYALLDPPAANGQAATVSDAQAYAPPASRDASAQAVAPQAAIAAVAGDGQGQGTVADQASQPASGADETGKSPKTAPSHAHKAVAKKAEKKDFKVAAKEPGKLSVAPLRTREANDTSAETTVKKSSAKPKPAHVAAKKAAHPEASDVALAKGDDALPAPAPASQR